jgi:hypothetical protein
MKGKSTFTRMGSVAAKINNVAVYALTFCLLLLFVKYVLLVQYSLRQKPPMDGYVRRCDVYIPWRAPGVEFIKVEFIVKNKQLQKSFIDNHYLKVHVINKAFESLKTRDSFLDYENDTIFYVKFYSDLDFIKNEDQQMDLERRIQDLHLVIIDNENKGWCFSPLTEAVSKKQKSLGSAVGYMPPSFYY